jgi:hypothetical protein
MAETIPIDLPTEGSDQRRGVIQGAESTEGQSQRTVHGDVGNGTDRFGTQAALFSQNAWTLVSNKELEYQTVNIIYFGGKEWMLSGWSFTYGKKMSQRMWVCPTRTTTAIVVVRKKNVSNFIVQSPDGEILDYGVCKRRRDAKALADRIIRQFAELGKVPLSETSREFRRWLM